MLDRMLLTSASEEKLFVEDCFATYLYTGNGSTQTINNGIDLSGKGGLVWLKSRSAATNNFLFDTARGVNVEINSNTTDANTTLANSVTAFNSNGFNLGAAAGINVNAATYASWTFRRAPKFFDVVTYTGNGANRTIAHNLGTAPGCIIVKRTDTTSDWQVYHRSNANTEYMVLNSTAAKATGATRWNSTTPTATEFTVGTDVTVNASGGTYVAYLFAHDTTADGIIQCGSFATDGSGNATVNLGWEPQFVLAKPAVGSGGDWRLLDVMRGYSLSGSSRIAPNTSGAELSGLANSYPTATGFYYTDQAWVGYIYIAIRRGPMRTPTLGTQVYNAIARTGTGAAATVTGVGFAPDLWISQDRNVARQTPAFHDRLRGAGNRLQSSSANAEDFYSNTLTALGNDGVSLGADGSVAVINSNLGGDTYINWAFRRAPGFFDVVCYTGTGVARTVNHNLGVAPELMIVKQRNQAASPAWAVYSSSLGAAKYLFLEMTAAENNFHNIWNNTNPTTSVFSLSDFTSTNSINGAYVAYLFASCPGVSKVGSYTGNGTSQTINCGFSAGARFVMIKRTDSTGDWYVWDTARGIVAANDPHLSLNTTAAEVTGDDSLDTNSTGFIVNQVAATNINVTGGSYIFLSIA